MDDKEFRRKMEYYFPSIKEQTKHTQRLLKEIVRDMEDEEDE